MTKELAIICLKGIKQYGRDTFTEQSDWQNSLNMAIQALEERKQGEWIIDDKEHGRIWHCHCSNCKKDPQDYIGGSENWWLVRLSDYCPNCGAEMRGDE